ncbi:MAG: hypothetical protein JO261_11600 [Alphaproteobacteria bacterium]|nr:hypothetical protein [Alphaproteobacteria bacterium]MBV9694333.1 hypothetical protein [Alphaproteobacteria bacterium]
MSRTLATVALALATGLSCAAFADDAAPAPQPAAQPAPPANVADKDKLVCRMMVHQGMLVRTQVCKTQEQWDNDRSAQQRSISDFQNRNFQTPH